MGPKKITNKWFQGPISGPKYPEDKFTMEQTERRRRVGRKRWGDLIRFLTDKMKTAKSEKVQMAAAGRLADILVLREQREQLELRRELREQAKAGDEPEETPEEEQQPLNREAALRDAEAFLAGIKEKETALAAQ